MVTELGARVDRETEWFLDVLLFVLIPGKSAQTNLKSDKIGHDTSHFLVALLGGVCDVRSVGEPLSVT